MLCKRTSMNKRELKHFIAMMKDKIVGKDPFDIINMDQSSIPYTPMFKQGAQNKGHKVNPCLCINHHHKQVALAITVIPSGKMMPPTLLFKGSSNG